MRRLKQWLLAFLVLAAIGGVLYVALNFVFIDFFVDMMWYGSLGYSGLFWLKILYKYMVFAAATLTFFLIVFLNFWIASRYLGTAEPKGSVKEQKTMARLIRAFRTGSMKLYTPLSIILAIPLAVPLFQQWESALLYIFGPKAGYRDPFFGIDASYYLFSLPVYQLLQGRLIITLLLLFISLAILYYLERRMLMSGEQPIPKGAKIHLSIVISLVFLVQAWGYILERHQLLYNTNNEPLFFGPGFTEIWVILPMIWLSAIFLLAAAISLVTYVNVRKGFYPFVIFTLLFVLSHAGRNWEFLPQVVNKYIVKPNELTRQTPYIQNAVRSTLAAYDLTDVETRDYRRQQSSERLDDPQFRANLENIPVWDAELLGSVFQQLQGIRPYYRFFSVDVGRYMVKDVLHQVFLSGREITLESLSQFAKNWVNVHLKYTHGHGLVMVPAAQRGGRHLQWYVRGIPPESGVGLEVKEPAIYYGNEDSPYAIAPNDIGELAYPGEAEDFTTDYKGTGGIPVSSLFKKGLFAVYFKNRNIFFTTKTNSNSRILIRRNIRESIPVLTPFLKLDRDPYLTLADGKLFWIQDAFTTSDWFPNAKPYEGGFNYIRNSVKIVVDAYNGSMDYYMADDRDPIVQAYSRMFPGLIKPMSRMPESLRVHVRYPRDLFEIQMQIYTKYHQTDPGIFYQDEDHWQFSQYYKQNNVVSMEPYYLTLDLIEPRKPEFLLFTPMSPLNRDNLRALAIAGSDGDNYGRIIVYLFPKGRQIYGPSQIAALIDQDTTIAQEITLWDQAGSEIMRGKMIIFPVGQDVVYIQPLYLESSAQLKIPELIRLIVSKREAVVMDVSLEKAFERLDQVLKERESGQEITAPAWYEEEGVGIEPAGEVGETEPPPESPSPENGGGEEATRSE